MQAVHMHSQAVPGLFGMQGQQGAATCATSMAHTCLACPAHNDEGACMRTTVAQCHVLINHQSAHCSTMTSSHVHACFSSPHPVSTCRGCLHSLTVLLSATQILSTPHHSKHQVASSPTLTCSCLLIPLLLYYALSLLLHNCWHCVAFQHLQPATLLPCTAPSTIGCNAPMLYPHIGLYAYASRGCRRLHHPRAQKPPLLHMLNSVTCSWLWIAPGCCLTMHPGSPITQHELNPK